MDPVQQAKQLVFSYNNNPKDYSDEQAEQIAAIAARMGLPFRSESKALQKFFFDLVDNATFGLLPDDQRPVYRGQNIYGETKSEKLAGNLSLLGLVVPGAAGAKAGAAGARAIMKRLPTKTKQILGKSDRASQAIMGGAAGAGSLAAMDLLEDPMGAPERAFSGAALGGLLGGAGLLRMTNPNLQRLNAQNAIAQLNAQNPIYL